MYTSSLLFGLQVTAGGGGRRAARPPTPACASPAGPRATMLLGNKATEIFALSVFPLGFVLFSLLVVSKVCCEWLRQKIIKFVDALLFFKCCGERSLTVFWMIMLVTVAEMATAVFDYRHVVGQRFNKHDCWTESCWNDHEKLL
eukprot:COSAG02_NODE_31235_length_537_cov_0.547945_1_plen_143_part_10